MLVAIQVSTKHTQIEPLHTIVFAFQVVMLMFMGIAKYDSGGRNLYTLTSTPLASFKRVVDVLLSVNAFKDKLFMLFSMKGVRNEM